MVSAGNEVSAWLDRPVRPGPADLALLALGVAGVSTSGPLIAATAAPALAVAFWRNAMALGVLAPATLIRHRAELARLPRSVVAGSVAAGLALAAHFALWVPSLRYTSVASSTALVCLQVVWTAVFARIAGQRLAGRAWFGMGVALAGVGVVTGVDVSGSPAALFGDGLALAGGVFSGAYVVAGARVRREASTAVYTTLCYGVCAGALLVVCLVAGAPLVGYDGADWARLVALTVAAQLAGHSVFNVVLRRVSPTLVSLVILLEVPGAATIAALALGQVPPVAIVPGLMLVLGGVALVVTARTPGYGPGPAAGRGAAG